MSDPSFSVALLHHPVYDKNGLVVATAVTNLDIHDIARAARTFGAASYHVITPVAEQQALVTRIVAHWQRGWGATYNPKRKAALDLVTVEPTLDAVIASLTRHNGRRPLTVVTGATGRAGSVTSSQLSERMVSGDDHYLLLFGTGWGMTEEIFAAADLVLEPIRGGGDYNHLSVRSAVAIYLDRLFGRR